MNDLECPDNCFDCAKKLSIFNNLNDEELGLINESKNTVKFSAGEIMLKQGTALTHMVCLTTGLAKVYLEGENNKNLILKFLRPSQIVGGPGFLTDQKLHFTVRAMEESYACFIDAEVLKEILKGNHEFAMELLKHGNQQAIRNYRNFISLTQKQMHGRIADALLHLSRNIFPEESNGFNISRQDLADCTAMAKESAIRILKEFSNEQLITIHGKKITVKQIEVLESISRKG